MWLPFAPHVMVRFCLSGLVPLAASALVNHTPRFYLRPRRKNIFKSVADAGAYLSAAFSSSHFNGKSQREKEQDVEKEFAILVVKYLWDKLSDSGCTRCLRIFRWQEL
ncbi:hypothetical protein DFH09DRAFT_1084181 [Mycena vulgaris]|nr:hypothetical protein DFH09DRAFT_1084181 [Mycena vulgaris]